MKRLSLLFFLMLLGVSGLVAQGSKGRYTATFEDGSMISYDLYQDLPTEIFSKHFTALSLANNVGITNEFSFQQIVPGKFLWKAGIMAGYFSGFGGVTASGIYYMGSAEREAHQRITIRTTYQGADHYTRYTTNVDVTKGKYWGIHGEAGFHRVGYKTPYDHTFNGGHYALESVAYGVVAAGFGYNSYRGLQVKIKDAEYVGGTRLFTAVADLVLYPGTVVTATASDSTARQHELKGKDVSNGMVGFHVYAQLQSSFLYHRPKKPDGCVGIVWRFGVIRAPYSNEQWNVLGSAMITPEMGLGLFYNF